MNILVSSIVDIKKSAHNSRLHQFLLYLSKHHKITVLCLNDNWKNKYDENSEKFQKSYQDLFKNIELKYLTEFNMPPFLQEILSFFLIFGITSKINLKNYDVHFSYNGILTSLLLTYLLSFFKIPTIYDVADDLPRMSNTSPQIPKALRGLSFVVSKKIFIMNLIKSSKITITTKQILSNYTECDNKIHILPNGVDTKLFHKKESSFRLKNSLQNYFIVGFVGVLREWVNFEPLFNALIALKSEYSIKVIIVGAGIYLENIIKNVHSKSLQSHVLFTGTINYDEIPDVINSFDVGIIPFDLDEVSQNSLPLKLFEYFACEVPVISSPIKSLKELFGDKLVYASSENDYRLILTDLINNPKKIQKLRKNIPAEIFNLYTWSNISRHLEKILKEFAV